MTEQQLLDNFNIAAHQLIAHMKKFESSRESLVRHMTNATAEALVLTYGIEMRAA